MLAYKLLMIIKTYFGLKMKILKKIKDSPLLQFLAMLASFAAFVIVLIYGNGILWQTDQAELERQKFSFEREKEATNLRAKIDETLNGIIKLSNDVYDKEKSNELTDSELKILKSRYDFLVENLSHYQKSLRKLTKRKIKKFNIPNPLYNYFDYIPPAKMTGLGIKRGKPQKYNFFLRKIQTNVITLSGIIIFFILISILFTRHFYLKKSNR
jgi:hypothetical protein